MFTSIGIPFFLEPGLRVSFGINAMDFALVPSRPAFAFPEIRPGVGLAISTPYSSKGSFVPRSSKLHLCSISAGAAVRAHDHPLHPAINPTPLRPLALAMLILIIACCPSCRPRGGIGINSLCFLIWSVFASRLLRQTASRHVPFIDLVLHVVLCLTKCGTTVRSMP